MQSDNCKEFYQAAFNLLETVMVCIELSTMDLVVSKAAALTGENDGDDLPSLGQEPWIHERALRSCLGSQFRRPRETRQPFELDLESASVTPCAQQCLTYVLMTPFSTLPWGMRFNLLHSLTPTFLSSLPASRPSIFFRRSARSSASACSSSSNSLPEFPVPKLAPPGLPICPGVVLCKLWSSR